MAALGLGSLGRLDGAERHARDAAARAVAPGDRADALAQAAMYVYRRGELDAAERLVREAEALAPETCREAHLVLAEVARHRGDFEAALASTERARALRSPGHLPAAQRRVDAAMIRQAAWFHAELGRLEEARRLLAEAEALDDQRADPKLGPMNAATAAWVHALRGETDAARARAGEAAGALPGLAGERSTRLSILLILARTALALGEPDRAEDFLRTLLEAGPDPCYRPAVFYYLAECRRRLGDRDGGRALDRQAASSRMGTRPERLARERLAADDGPAA